DPFDTISRSIDPVGRQNDLFEVAQKLSTDRNKTAIVPHSLNLLLDEKIAAPIIRIGQPFQKSFEFLPCRAEFGLFVEEQMFRGRALHDDRRKSDRFRIRLPLRLMEEYRLWNRDSSGL